MQPINNANSTIRGTAFAIGIAALVFTINGKKVEAASLTPEIDQDSPTNLNVVWTWNPETLGSSVVPNLKNWTASINLLEPDGVIFTQRSFIISVQHLPNGPALGFGNPIPLDGLSITDTTNVSNDTGKDFYRYIFNRETDPARIRLTGYHTVPEPLTILGSGLALGFGTLMERQSARKRKKAKQTD